MVVPIVDEDDTTKGRRSDKAKEENPTQATISQSILRETANKLIREFAARTIIEDNNKQIWVFTNGFYEPFGEQIFRQLLNENNWPQPDITKVLKIIKSIAGIRRSEFQIDLSHNFTFVNLENCVRNWKTGETFEHDPKYVFKYKFPVVFAGESAGCPLFSEMVDKMFVSEEDIREFKKWCGYQLLNSSHYQKAMFIVGPAGYSKGTLLRTITKVIGEHNCSAAPLKVLCNPNGYSIKFIEHKIANICADLATSVLTGAELSTYYNITGEDLMHGRELRFMPTDFRPRAKLSWAFNKLPMMSMGVFSYNEFWRRCNLIETRSYEYVDDPEFEERLTLEIPGIYSKFFEEGIRLLVKEGFRNYKKDDYKELKMKWLKKMRSASEEDIIKEPRQLLKKLTAEEVKKEDMKLFEMNAEEVKKEEMNDIPNVEKKK